MIDLLILHYYTCKLYMYSSVKLNLFSLCLQGPSFDRAYFLSFKYYTDLNVITINPTLLLLLFTANIHLPRSSLNGGSTVNVDFETYYKLIRVGVLRFRYYQITNQNSKLK